MTDITAGPHLNPPRRHRTCPRAVRRTRRNGYPSKKPGDTSTRHDGPPAIHITPGDTRTAA